MTNAKTAAQRKAAERHRKRDAGLEEVRGIYAQKNDHAPIKEYATKFILKFAKLSPSDNSANLLR